MMGDRSIKYGVPLRTIDVDADLERSFTLYLRERGYLVLPPGEDSAAAELIAAMMAAQALKGTGSVDLPSLTKRLVKATAAAEGDSDIGRWLGLRLAQRRTP